MEGAALLQQAARVESLLASEAAGRIRAEVVRTVDDTLVSHDLLRSKTVSREVFARP